MSTIGVIPSEVPVNITGSATTMNVPLSPTCSDHPSLTSSSTSSGSSSGGNVASHSSFWWSNRGSSSAAAVSKPRQQQQEQEQARIQAARADELRQIMLQESVRGNVNLLQRRPGRICVIFPRNAQQAQPDLQFRSEGSFLVLDHIEPGSILDVQNPITKPFLEQSTPDGNLMQVGDVVESINGLACTSETTPLQIAQACDSDTGLVSITLSTLKHSNSAPGLCQVVLLKSPQGFSQHEDGNDCPEQPFPDLGLQLVRRQGLLQIQGLSASSCLTTLGATSILEPGDFCVAMATTLCAALEANDAKSLWQLQQETCRDDCLSLLAIRASDAQRRWNRVRRAAVAVGGGTLLGVGGVLMVTPLHPVGHAMTIGAVGVLGTEFEGPKRALQAAKDKFTRRGTQPAAVPTA